VVLVVLTASAEVVDFPALAGVEIWGGHRPGKSSASSALI
jgi:hypothetical protein